MSRRKALRVLRRWDRYLSRYPHGEIGWCRITPGWGKAYDRCVAVTTYNKQMHVRHLVLARLDGRNSPKGWGYPWKLSCEEAALVPEVAAEFWWG